MTARGRHADFEQARADIVRAVQRDNELTMAQLKARFHKSSGFIRKALVGAGLQAAREVPTADVARATGASKRVIQRIKKERAQQL